MFRRLAFNENGNPALIKIFSQTTQRLGNFLLWYLPTSAMVRGER
jgi:hypothetical protein